MKKHTLSISAALLLSAAGLTVNAREMATPGSEVAERPVAAHVHRHRSPQEERDAKLQVSRQATAKDPAAKALKDAPQKAGKPNLADQVLPIKHTCSSTLRIRAQSMSSAELSATCQKLATQESYFHQRAATNNTPVANDYNTSLEVVVFNNYDQYKRYAGRIYGISTNNGGMYLEGNPADPNNQARFIAHEADWLLPNFVIWNLEHEYTHYLDGRFDMYGDFSASTSKPTIWWIEGVAEYMALKDNNPDAITEARKRTYTLSTLFQTTYSHDATRVYDWGYLAVRFMFERHRADVDQILYLFRTGQYTAYQNYISGIGSSYDSEFNSWLLTVSSTP